MNNGNILGNLVVGGQFKMDCVVLDVPIGFGGNETCAKAGYDFRVAQENKQTTTYYDSTNRACTGNIQVEMNDYNLASCAQGGGGGGGCATQPTGVEPYTGDHGFRFTTSRTLCCK